MAAVLCAGKLCRYLLCEQQLLEVQIIRNPEHLTSAFVGDYVQEGQQQPRSASRRRSTTHLQPQPSSPPSPALQTAVSTSPPPSTPCSSPSPSSPKLGARSTQLHIHLNPLHPRLSSCHSPLPLAAANRLPIIPATSCRTPPSSTSRSTSPTTSSHRSSPSLSSCASATRKVRTQETHTPSPAPFHARAHVPPDLFHWPARCRRLG